MGRRRSRLRQDALFGRDRESGFAFLFWGVIWAFTGFEGEALPIFLGLAILTSMLSHAGRRARRGREATATTGAPFGAGPAGPQDDGQEPAPAALAEPAPPPRPLHETLIAAAAGDRLRIEAAASVASGQLGADLRGIDTTLDEIERSLRADPSRLSDAQRVFTYYLPALGNLLTARGTVGGDAGRVAEIDRMVGQIAQAFRDVAGRLQGQDARSLDIDLKLLEQSLSDEFGVTSRSKA